ncbi:hypothetical protein J6590_016443 [Homalodisca vitripennis]|nr:hypothetical protein J6590_016443 [Homalodisca vitripennis]
MDETSECLIVLRLSTIAGERGVREAYRSMCKAVARTLRTLHAQGRIAPRVRGHVSPCNRRETRVSTPPLSQGVLRTPESQIIRHWALAIIACNPWISGLGADLRIDLNEYVTAHTCALYD